MWFMPCKVVEPVYESKDDYEIFRQLALRIGGNETEQKFTESKSYMEWLGSKMAEIYPFHLISPHPKYRVNSQLDNTWVRNVYKIQGREPVMINELDAN